MLQHYGPRGRSWLQVLILVGVCVAHMKRQHGCKQFICQERDHAGSLQLRNRRLIHLVHVHGYMPSTGRNAVQCGPLMSAVYAPFAAEN